LLRSIFRQIDDPEAMQRRRDVGRHGFGHGDQRYVAALPTGTTTRGVQPFFYRRQAGGEDRIQRRVGHGRSFDCRSAEGFAKITAFPGTVKPLDEGVLMADIRAFRAFRYDPGRVGALGDVIAPPYDVIDASLQQALYDKSPYNVVRLILN